MVRIRVRVRVRVRVSAGLAFVRAARRGERVECGQALGRVRASARARVGLG